MSSPAPVLWTFEDADAGLCHMMEVGAQRPPITMPDAVSVALNARLSAPTKPALDELARTATDVALRTLHEIADDPSAPAAVRAKAASALLSTNWARAPSVGINVNFDGSAKAAQLDERALAELIFGRAARNEQTNIIDVTPTAASPT